MTWVITGGPTTYQVMRDVGAFRGPFTMTLNGSSFTISGSEDLAGGTIDYLGIGNFADSTLSGTWTEPTTDPMQQNPQVDTGTITGTR